MNKKLVPAIALMTAALASGVVPCYASTTSEKIDAASSEYSSSVSQLNSIEDRIRSLESKKDQTEAYLKELNSQLSDLQTQYDDLQTQYEDESYKLLQLEADLTKANADKKTQYDAMKKRIQYMYENSSGSGVLESLFSSESFSDFLDRADNMKELTRYDRRMLKEYAATCESIEEKTEQEKQEKERIEELQTKCEQNQEDIQKLVEATSADMKEITASISEEQSSASELAQEVAQQEATLSSLVEQKKTEDEAAAEETASASEASGESSSENTGSTASVSGKSTGTASGGSSNSASGKSSSESSGSSSGSSSSWTGSKLTKSGGVNQGPSGKETFYNMDMSGVVSTMRSMGNTDQYWVRSDGVKMLGDYVMVAANLNTHSMGSLVETSLGTGIVCDTGGFASKNATQLDIAVEW